MTNIEIICSILSDDELYCQLAEEAAELGHAALKLRRARSGINHTPVAVADAYKSIMEEIADVMLCLRTIGFEIEVDDITIKSIVDAKAARWVRRLKIGV